MGDGEGTRGEEGLERRAVVYCLIPRELAGKLHEPLRGHFRDEPGVEVVVERRGRERRSGADRRRAEGGAPPSEERRHVHAPSGRRVGERRAELIPISPPELPRRARRYAEQLSFVERLEPPTEQAEDRDTARLVAAFQAGDGEAFGTLYTRYFDRVYSYLRVLLKDRHEAEDAAQQVFADVFASLPRYEQRDRPFRAWLFTVVRHQAIRLLRRGARVSVVDPGEIDAEREAAGAADVDSEALETPLTWLTDPDLIVLVERLPEPQRQVLGMRYLLGLPMQEIAAVLGVTPNHASVLHYRALGFLRKRLAALGRTPERRDRGPRTKVVLRHARVLRRRRYALDP